MIDDLRLRSLASAQHGLVSVEQSIELGYSHLDRELLADGRRWQRATPRVLRLVGSTPTRAHRAMHAVLDAGPGAALRAGSALAWWGAPGVRLEPFEVVRVRGHVRRPERLGARHEPILLPEHHVVTLEGVPTVVPARALFDLAGSQRRGADLEWWVDRMARIVDSAWAKRLVSGDTLHDMLAELAQRGRPGIRVMRQILRERPRSYVPPASNLESRLAQILRSAGLPALRRQVDSGNGAQWIGRVDFRAINRPLIVEVQSERFHSSVIDRQLDAKRIERLTSAGFTVVEAIEEEIWHRPHHVVREITDALRRTSPAS